MSFYMALLADANPSHATAVRAIVVEANAMCWERCRTTHSRALLALPAVAARFFFIMLGSSAVLFSVLGSSVSALFCSYFNRLITTRRGSEDGSTAIILSTLLDQG